MIELSFGQISSITVNICSKTQVKTHHTNQSLPIQNTTKSIHLLGFFSLNADMICRYNKDSIIYRSVKLNILGTNISFWDVPKQNKLIPRKKTAEGELPYKKGGCACCTF